MVWWCSGLVVPWSCGLVVQCGGLAIDGGLVLVSGGVCVADCKVSVVVFVSSTMTRSVDGYQDLDVWRHAICLTEMVYRVSAELPGEEKYGLAARMRRAAVSVPANIAEGAERFGVKEYLRFLGIASGSLAEVDTHLILAARLGLVDEGEARSAREQVGATARMLTGLKRSLLRRR